MLQNFQKNLVQKQSYIIDRLFAVFADALIQLIILLIYFTVLTFYNGNQPIQLTDPLGELTAIFILVLGPAYHIFFLIILGDQTPGKKLLNLHIVSSLNGSNLNLWQMANREIFKSLFYNILPFVGNLIDLVFIIQNENNQSFTDWLSKTKVVKIQLQKK